LAEAVNAYQVKSPAPAGSPHDDEIIIPCAVRASHEFR
jgi:hypothetical protein